MKCSSPVRLAVPAAAAAFACVMTLLGCGRAVERGGVDLPAARSSRGPPSRGAASAGERFLLQVDFRPHVEFASRGAVDWGNGRYLVRVSAPLDRTDAAGRAVPEPVAESRATDACRAAAAAVALELASGLRVDAGSTLSNLTPDAGTLRLYGNVAGMRVLKKKLGDERLQIYYAVPMLGVNGVVSRLYERAAGGAGGAGAPARPDGLRRAPPRPWGQSSRDTSRAAERVPWGSPVPPVFAGSAPAVQGDAASRVPQFDVTRLFAGASPGGGWDIDWRLERPKDELPEPRMLAAVAPTRAGNAKAAPGPPARARAARREPVVIVIDARGTGLRAALFPVVKDEAGGVVYGAGRASREAVVTGGLVQYVELPPEAAARRGEGTLCPRSASSPTLSLTLNELRALDRLLAADGGAGGEGGGDSAGMPRRRRRRRRVVLKAAAASGALKANVILSQEDAEKLKAEGDAVGEARVIVVTDTAVGGLEGLRGPPQATKPRLASR